MGTKQEMTRTGTCKNTSHPEKMTVFSGVSLQVPKAGMSITIMLSISELLLMHLFWGTFETPDINISEILHGKILLPDSGRQNKNHALRCLEVGILC